MLQHLGDDKHAAVGKNTGNSRNGISRKTLIADDGDGEIDTPRDRDGSFELSISFQYFPPVSVQFFPVV